MEAEAEAEAETRLCDDSVECLRQDAVQHELRVRVDADFEHVVVVRRDAEEGHEGLDQQFRVARRIRRAARERPREHKQEVLKRESYRIQIICPILYMYCTCT